MPTALLVHGAWHGAWCWDRVRPGLADRGVDAVAIDLPGHGDDHGPAGDLAGDVARVRAALDGRPDGSVVLVGHSYGGIVITGAGDHPAVAHLVYLAALMVAEGETGQSAGAPADTAGIDHGGRVDAGAHLHIDDAGVATVDAEGARLLFYGDCDDATVAWASSRLCPQALLPLGQPVEAVAWRTKPSTYVVCTEDDAVHPQLQRILGRRAGTVVEWPTSHSPFLSRPELVVDLVSDIARGL